MPSWMSFDTASWKFYGNPDAAADITATITATDTYSKTVTNTIRFNTAVNAIPAMTHIPEKVLTVSTAGTYDISSYFSDTASG